MTSYHVVGRQSFTKPQRERERERERERDNKLLIIFDGGVSFLSKAKWQTTAIIIKLESY